MGLRHPQTRTYTIEEFEQFIALPENADRRFELIDGEIVEKVPTEEHGVIAARILMWLERLGLLGRVAVEPRHRMPEDRRNSRIPDVAYTSAERVLPLTRKGAVPQMPDLAVEIKSPDDSVNLLRSKAIYYLANGARMAWLIYPEQRLVDNEERHDSVDGGDVLPRFTLTLRDIFPA